MEEINDVRDTLRGGYGGLYGEVVDCDVYQLAEVRYDPRVIYDIGANVGVFTRFARKKWPNALIVCVEPDPENFKYLTKFTPNENIVFINKAIGFGQLWRCLGGPNGAHESYLSETTGYPKELMVKDKRVVRSEVETILLDEIINQYYLPGTILKLDCEGGEAAIFNHAPSMEAMKKIDYIVGEYHNMASTAEQLEAVAEETLEGLHYFDSTHNVRIHHPNFWAFRK